MTPAEGQPVAPQPPTPPVAAAPAPALLSIEDFAKLAFKVGTIKEAAAHPNADRLLVLSIDLGEAAPRQVVAGIRATYPPETLIGKQVVVVANLKPATLRGVESQGMVLAASDAGQVIIMTPERAVTPGSTVK